MIADRPILDGVYPDSVGNLSIITIDQAAIDKRDLITVNRQDYPENAANRAYSEEGSLYAAVNRTNQGRDIGTAVMRQLEQLLSLATGYERSRTGLIVGMTRLNHCKHRFGKQ